ILIFCGNEFAWHRSDLEDFADFYHTGRHSADDPFALMEQHYLKENGVQLERNIDHFGFLKRLHRDPDNCGILLAGLGAAVWPVSQLSATNLLARFERRLDDLVTEWARDHHGVRLAPSRFSIKLAICSCSSAIFVKPCARKLFARARCHSGDSSRRFSR